MEHQTKLQWIASATQGIFTAETSFGTVHRSARETPAFMPGRDSAARGACPFLSHPPFGLL